MLSNTYYIELSEGEDLDEVEARIMANMEFHCSQHQDFSATIVKNVEGKYIKVNTLRLEEEAN